MAKQAGFGVCYCDLTAYKPKPHDLILFSDYDEAYAHYLKKVLAEYEKTKQLPKDLWVVFIERGRIVQFDGLAPDIHCKLIDLP